MVGLVVYLIMFGLLLLIWCVVLLVVVAADVCGLGLPCGFCLVLRGLCICVLFSALLVDAGSWNLVSLLLLLVSLVLFCVYCVFAFVLC